MRKFTNSNYKIFCIVFTIGIILISCNDNSQNENKSKFTKLTGPYLGQKPPGKVPKLFAAGIVSTKEYNDRDLTISPDGSQVFFTRYKIEDDSVYFVDIMYSELINGIWTNPQIAWFSSIYGEVETFFTPDGKEIFFNSNRPALTEGEKVDYETWFIKKEGNTWSLPKLLGSPFNRVCHTTFTRNGKMYYTKEDEFTLYRTTYKDGVFGQPEKLDSIINSTEVQYNCFISHDESYLIFTCPLREDGFGSEDLYISFRSDNDEWSEPTNLGSEINSPEDESSPSISPDGKFFFFTSNKGGNRDIYWVDIKILDKLKPNEMKNQN